MIQMKQKIKIKEYKYDVFFSYKRDELTLFWMKKLVDHLKHWVTQELGGKKAKFFFDINNIHTGSDWPVEIREALKTSKCMVGVWTPEYFRSEWCISEWKNFMLREENLKINETLIIPIKYHDGEHFPPEAKIRQQFDLTDYACPIEAFWESQKAVDLVYKIKEIAPNIAKAIKKAPPFDPEWKEIIIKPEKLSKIAFRSF